jgi:IS605 OrfB family transposase
MDKRVITYLTFTKDFDVKSNCGSVVAVNVNESNVTIAMFRNHSLAEILGLRMVIAYAERRISRGSSTKDREIKRRLRRLREKERKIDILRKTAGFIENLALENNAVVVVGDIDRDVKERMEEKKTNEPRYRMHKWSVLTLIKLLEEKPIHVVRVGHGRGIISFTHTAWAPSSQRYRAPL